MPSVTPVDLIGSIELSSDFREATLAGFQFAPPWSRLARVDGWVLWLGHPPIPDELDLVPTASHLVWDEPVTALGLALAVSLDYAARRYAIKDEIAAVLAREAPLAILVPGEVDPSVRNYLEQVELLGVPVVRASIDAVKSIQDLSEFNTRRQAHAVDLGRPHDPVFTFEQFDLEQRIGDNSLSSFVLHPEGERDGVFITGEMSDRVGIEIGVSSPHVGVGQTLRLEREAAQMPAFLEGVGANLSDQTLEIGWRSRNAPTAEQIGGAIYAWLKSFYGLDLVDVRIVFAPRHGRSARLIDMRERAKLYSAYRTSAIADLNVSTERDGPNDGP